VGKYKLKELGKIVEYILQHRPDEFGLFLNDDGSLPIKELMWALHEEAGWKHVRHGHLKELAYSGLQFAFTVEEKHIRPQNTPSQALLETAPPRLLYFAARRKAYPVILKHGLRPGGRAYVPLATTEDLARRIGRRRDPKPILLTILAASAHDSGHRFFNCGELLYLVNNLPPPFLSGPPIRETPQHLKVSRPTRTEAQEPEIPQMIGSFLLDPDRDPDLMRRQRRKQQKDRKRQISQERSRKRRRS
jgi:putative RNA 2'-phosphotransferase